MLNIKISDSFVLLLYRGTHLSSDWQDNLQTYMIGSPQNGKFHAGFYNRAKKFPLQKFLNEKAYEGRNLIFCGHSLGGAVAAIVTIFALQAVKKREGFGDRRKIRCFTFGAPMIGDADLKQVFCWLHTR